MRHPGPTPQHRPHAASTFSENFYCFDVATPKEPRLDLRRLTLQIFVAMQWRPPHLTIQLVGHATQQRIFLPSHQFIATGDVLPKFFFDANSSGRGNGAPLDFHRIAAAARTPTTITLPDDSQFLNSFLAKQLSKSGWHAAVQACPRKPAHHPKHQAIHKRATNDAKGRDLICRMPVPEKWNKQRDGDRDGQISSHRLHHRLCNKVV